MKKKILCMILGASSMLLFTGCAMPLNMFERVTAESLMENAFQDSVTAYDMDIVFNLDAEMDLSNQGMNGFMEMSMGLDANMKTNGEYGHMEGDVQIKVFGTKMNEEMEVYYDYDEGVAYTYDSESDIWMAEETDNEGMNLGSINKDIFDGLTLQEHKRGEDYIVTATIDSDNLDGIMPYEGMDGMNLGDGIDDYSMDVTLTFDEKSKQVKSMDISIGDMDAEGMEISDFVMSVSFNQIGGEVEVKIPKKVVKNAVWGNDDIQDLIDSIDSADSAQGQSDYSSGDETDDIDINDTFGSYNRVAFVAGIDVQTFLDDGWVMDEDFDGIFVPCDNDKYKDADFYLYGTKNKIKPDDLYKNGVFGYNMRVTYCDEGAKLPNMIFRGLTWGATQEEIVDAYGEPTDIYDLDTLMLLRYKCEDGTEMEFHIQTDNEFGINGLTEVSVINYSFMQE